MFGPIERKGFCRGCVQNIRKVREIESSLFRFLDWLTFRSASLFQIGPWKCRYCGTKSLFLSAPINGIRDLENDQRDDETVENEMSHGNFIVQQQSIAGVLENSDRFSRKYRDGVAAKVLKGESAITQICDELNVTERDLISWIREYVDTQQQLLAEEIHQLKHFISQANQETLAIRYRQQFEDDQSAADATTGRNQASPDEPHSKQSPPIVEGKARPLMD